MTVKRYFAVAALAATFSLMAIAAQAQNNNSQEIMAQGQPQLIKMLENPSASVFDKAKACQRLAVIGTKDAIPALVALLPDETLNVYARCGLEGIPDPAVDEAFRAAAEKLHGRALSGVLNSIGQRKDASAVSLLKGFLSNSDALVVTAAATALGHITTSESVAALKDALAQPSAAKAGLGNGALTCAQALREAGNKADAMALCDAVAAQVDLPKHQIMGALYGQFLAGKNDKEFVLSQLQSADELHFGLGLAMARLTPGADMTTAFVAELGKLPNDRQARLLRALGARADRMPTTTLDAAAKSESPEISAAALDVLTSLNDASAAGIFLDIALSDKPAAVVAKEGLKKLAGEGVDAAIIGKLAGQAGNEKAQMLLLELAGARHMVSARSAVVGALESSQPAVKLAAIEALGFLTEPKDFDMLAKMALAGDDSPESKAAKKALQTAAIAAGDREAAAAKIVSLMQGATGASRDILLATLGKVGGKAALEAVIADAKSSDVAIKDAATKALGEWPNAEVAPTLLELAKSETDAKYRIRAIRGYIRVGRQLQLTDDERLDLFKTAMATADRVEDKKLALDILTRIQSPKALQTAVVYLKDNDLKNDAATAAVAVGKKIVKKNPQAVVDGMKKILAANVENRTARGAKNLMEQAQSGQKGKKKKSGR